MYGKILYLQLTTTLSSCPTHGVKLQTSYLFAYLCTRPGLGLPIVGHETGIAREASRFNLGKRFLFTYLFFGGRPFMTGG